MVNDQWSLRIAHCQLKIEEVMEDGYPKVHVSYRNLTRAYLMAH